MSDMHWTECAKEAQLVLQEAMEDYGEATDSEAQQSVRDRVAMSLAWSTLALAMRGAE